MKNKLLSVVLLTLIVAAAPAFGAILIDFSGLGGGTITQSGGNASTTNVSIQNMLVSGTGTSKDGNYLVTNGLLSFDTAAGTISITGQITGACGLVTPCGDPTVTVAQGALLTGTGDSFTVTNPNGTIEVHGSGPDIKSAALLSALGLSTSLPFSFSGFSIGGVSIGDGRFTATSTDISNTSNVPEPTSVALLGGVVFLAARTLRRKFQSKA